MTYTSFYVIIFILFLCYIIWNCQLLFLYLQLTNTTTMDYGKIEYRCGQCNCHMTDEESTVDFKCTKCLEEDLEEDEDWDDDDNMYTL